MRTMLRRAFSIAFCTAAGTSRALPRPMPTRPAPSPTTVSAEKPNCRPPLTTLATRRTLMSFSWKLSARCSFSPYALTLLVLSSELQAAFTRGIRQRLDATVVTEAGAVEGHARDAGALGLLGDALADQLGRFDIATVLEGGAHLGFKGRGRAQHLAAAGVDDLGVDVLRRAVHAQAHGLETANSAPDPGGAPGALLFFAVHRSDPLLLLGFFLHDNLVDIAHALALVRLRRTVVANIRRHLADKLLVRALDHQVGLMRRLDGDAGRNVVHDRVRVAERQVQFLSGNRGAVTDADDGELLLETLAHARDHVVHQRARGAGNGACQSGVVGALELEQRAFLRHRHQRVNRLFEGALRTLDTELAGGEFDLDAARNGYRILGNAGHGVIVRSLRHHTQHFATEAGLARGAVGHHPPGGGHHGDAEAAVDARQRRAATVNTQTRLAGALDTVDHRTAVVILERDLKHVLGAVTDFVEAFDVALVLQHLGDGAFHARRRHAHAQFLGMEAVADARQHVGNRIGHHKISSKYQVTSGKRFV